MLGPFTCEDELPQRAKSGNKWLYVVLFEHSSKVGVTVDLKTRFQNHCQSIYGHAYRERLVCAYARQMSETEALFLERTVAGCVRCRHDYGLDWFDPALFPLAVAVAEHGAKGLSEPAGLLLLRAREIADALKSRPWTGEEAA